MCGRGCKTYDTADDSVLWEGFSKRILVAHSVLNDDNGRVFADCGTQRIRYALVQLQSLVGTHYVVVLFGRLGSLFQDCNVVRTCIAFQYFHMGRVTVARTHNMVAVVLTFYPQPLDSIE